MKVFYSSDYVAAAHAFPTTRKAGWIADSLRADPIAGIDRGRPGRCLAAQIGAPRLAARAGRLRQCLALLIGSRQAAEVGPLAGAGAGHEEAHIGRLRCGLLRLHRDGAE